MEPILAAAPPIIAGLVQTVRPLLDSRWLPLLSIGLGEIVVAAFALSGQIPWTEVPLAGLLTGLSASGLYSVLHTTVGAK